MINRQHQKKIQSLGIKSIGRKIIWTDEMIKDLYNKDLSNAYIAKKYGVSETATTNKRKSLGLSRH